MHEKLNKNSQKATYNQIWSSINNAFWPSFIFSFLIVISFFLVGKEKLMQFLPQLSPRSIQGLGGIFFAPFVHDSVNHLYNNILPLFVALLFLFWHYKPIAWRVLIFGWVITGFWVWTGGRNAIHIGASGLVYAYMAFLVISGFIRKNKPLLALSLLLVTFYGGLVWGVFPIDYKVSWESHLYGAVAGVVLAYYYRNSNLPAELLPPPEMEEEEPDFDDWKLVEDYQNANDLQKEPKIDSSAKPYAFKYHYKPNDPTQ